eukprot:s2113_g8.t4
MFEDTSSKLSQSPTESRTFEIQFAECLDLCPWLRKSIAFIALRCPAGWALGDFSPCHLLRHLAHFGSLWLKSRGLYCSNARSLRLRMSTLQELQDKVADLQKQNEILGMENEMLADYLQRDAERTSGLEDTDEALSDLPSSPVDKGKKAAKGGRQGQQRRQLPTTLSLEDRFRIANQEMEALTKDIAEKGENSQAEYIDLPCFSMRDPYASLLLHGVKTVETRNWPMLKDISGPCLLHIGHKTMDESVAGEFLWRNDLADPANLEGLLQPPMGFQRGQVLGLVDLATTCQYTKEQTRQEDVQKAVASEAGAWWVDGQRLFAKPGG